MPPAKPSIQEVIDQANAARQQLALLERELQEGIDSIDLTAFKEKRDLTDAEQAERKELRGTQAEVREDFRVLAFVTAQRLDNAAEVDHLLRQVQAINAGLVDDLNRLKKIERYAEIAAKVADALAKAAEKLAKVAAKGALPI